MPGLLDQVAEIQLRVELAVSGIEQGGPIGVGDELQGEHVISTGVVRRRVRPEFVVDHADLALVPVPPDGREALE
ncbi:Uncharacterised protein [Mycobacteroides abscessus subsp. massiliense]|nr:Uncharacterised protein [Mycobacteroides abscessus subsp. massiliense]